MSMNCNERETWRQKHSMNSSCSGWKMYYIKWVFSLYFGICQHVLCASMHISHISLKKNVLSFVSWSSVASLIKSHSNNDSFCLSPTQVTKQMRDFKIFNALFSASSSSSSYRIKNIYMWVQKHSQLAHFDTVFENRFFSFLFFSMLVTF